MNFRAALRRLNRLVPPSSKNEVDEEIRAVLAPLTYEEKITLRDVLEEKLLEAKVEGKLDDDDKREIRSKLESAARREKKRNRPKTCDSDTRATENRTRSSRKGLTAINNAVPPEVSTAPGDPMAAEESITTNNARSAKFPTAHYNTTPPKVPAVPNNSIPPYQIKPSTRGIGDRSLPRMFPNPPPEEAADPDWGGPNWTPRRR